MSRSATTRRRYLRKRLKWFFRDPKRRKPSKNTARASTLVKGGGDHSISRSDIQRIQQELAEEGS